MVTDRGTHNYISVFLKSSITTILVCTIERKATGSKHYYYFIVM